MGIKHVALLRGVNVGGKNKLPMEALRQVFAKSGAKDVTSYIQSGNVLFSADPAAVERIIAKVHTTVQKDFGMNIPVVARSLDELKTVISANPYLAAGLPENSLHVFFLADVPDSPAITSLDAKRSPGDEFAVQGREIYAYLPNGAGNSKLTNAYFDSKLRTISTMRNWRTVMTLQALMAK